MLRIEFFIDGKPQPKARARVVRFGNKVRSYTPESTANYELYCKWLGSMKMTGMPLITRPVRMTLTIQLLPPESWSASRKYAAVMGTIAPTKKPDASNILKSIEDALNGVVYKDDSQIVELAIKKIYSNRQGVQVLIEQLEILPAP